MKIYTKTGDTGTTSLLGGTRVEKHDLRIDCYGSLDELNAWLGLLRDQDMESRFRDTLLQVQENLFTIGAFLATDPKKMRLKNGKPRLDIAQITQSDVENLEWEIDLLENQLPKMTHFILPGGHPTVSYCHVARTVCRRAERRMTLLNATEPMAAIYLIYVNRLSDFLFVLARKLSQDLKVKEIPWIPKKLD